MGWRLLLQLNSAFGVWALGREEEEEGDLSFPSLAFNKNRLCSKTCGIDNTVKNPTKKLLRDPI